MDGLQGNWGFYKMGISKSVLLGNLFLYLVAPVGFALFTVTFFLVWFRPKWLQETMIQRYEARPDYYPFKRYMLFVLKTGLWIWFARVMMLIPLFWFLEAIVSIVRNLF